jgi:hypothetical protein
MSADVTFHYRCRVLLTVDPRIEFLDLTGEVAELGLAELHLPSLENTRSGSTLNVIKLAAELVLATAEVLSEFDLQLAALRCDLIMSVSR